MDPLVLFTGLVLLIFPDKSCFSLFVGLCEEPEVAGAGTRLFVLVPEVALDRFEDSLRLARHLSSPVSTSLLLLPTVPFAPMYDDGEEERALPAFLLAT